MTILLTITGAVRGSSREKLYRELDLEILNNGYIYNKKHYYFYKILKSHSPKYLYSIFSISSTSYRTIQCKKIPVIKVNQDFFKSSFFITTIIELNKLE